MFRRMRKRILEDANPSGTAVEAAVEDGSDLDVLDIHWDTVASELMSFMTMATLAMLYMMANISALDAEELEGVFHDGLGNPNSRSIVNSKIGPIKARSMVTHPDIFMMITWTGVYLTGGAWIMGLLIYIKYINARLKHAPYPAAEIFLKQFAGELKIMYWMLMFAAVCAMASAYHLTVFKTPLEGSEGMCKKLYGPTAKAPCIRAGSYYVWGSTLFGLLPTIVFGYGYLWHEEKQFKKKIHASRVRRGLSHAAGDSMPMPPIEAETGTAWVTLNPNAK